MLQKAIRDTTGTKIEPPYFVRLKIKPYFCPNMTNVFIMQKTAIRISHIPAIIWGSKSEKVIIAIHGNRSNKADTPIEIVTQNALPNDYQVLSFDLPEHGDRINEGIPCKVRSCVKDLITVMQYAKTNWMHIDLFANSIGAYFSLLAYPEEVIGKAWFLSPIVDMRRLIENMMTWFSITEEELKRQQTISTPIGQKLYWDYYSFVKDHPISHWNTPTHILYGSKDELCENDVISRFAEQFSCQLEIVEGSEHYFHTQEQLTVFNEWIGRTL